MQGLLLVLQLFLTLASHLYLETFFERLIVKNSLCWISSTTVATNKLHELADVILICSKKN